MNTCFRNASIVIVALTATMAFARSETPSGPDEPFQEARAAYDAGRFADALKLYEGIREQGQVSAALYFNMGNVLVRLGRFGEAVLSYRRAQYLHPRDPDATANLHFTQDITHALNPEYSAAATLLGRLTRGEWTAIGLIAYWLGAIALAVYRLHPRRPRLFLRLAALALPVLLLAGFGLLHWRSLARMPEVVLQQRDVQSRFAPLSGATPHFKVPEGSIVRLVDRSGDWLKVAAGHDEGWIPAGVTEPVLPLQ